MPLYDYRCQKCGETFEVRQKFSDTPLTVHEGCGGGVVKQLSAPSFQFKGTGWYVTDYGRNGKTHSENGKSSKSESAKSESKSDSKPEKKAEPVKTSAEK